MSGKPEEEKVHNYIRVAIFASGAGSNAKKIIENFKDHLKIKVSLVVSNKPEAGVLQVASDANIPVLLINKEYFNASGYVNELKNAGIDFIALAGFLWKMPETLIQEYRNKIINIHPALLPAYGGKGMYGMKVHEAVIAAGEKESGITIHYVDEKYDNGDIIFQATCPVLPGDTAATLAEKIHTLEHDNFSKIIEQCIKDTFPASFS